MKIKVDMNPVHWVRRWKFQRMVPQPGKRWMETEVTTPIDIGKYTIGCRVLEYKIEEEDENG